jgi:2,3-bisphosphoglycerate-independent phosphoglycerate mutase
MEQLDLIRSLAEEKDSKILLLVLDGLGGLATEPGGKTELETARTPNLDALARESSCGLMELVAPGITPGSGPGHLALFGYDPITYIIQRGALEAAGIDFPQQAGDVATRANFCTIDADGNITDRRAGRIPTEESAALCALLQRKITLEGVELFIQPVQEHRAVVVFRGKGLGDQVHDTDPQQTGVPPLPPKASSDDPASQRTAQLASKFLARVREVLRGKHPKANMMMLRGFSLRPHLPQFGEVYKLKAAAEATYPMYRGLARLVGMEILTPRATFAECVEEVASNWAKFDFFFLHYKYTDSQGEDGNFAKKVEAVETVDAELPKLLALKPDVVAVTGDHSTPSKLASHSWHPVPVLVRSPYVRADGLTKFGESACVRGSLGHFAAVHLMPLLLANALRLAKYGA